jgi:hypothetical protein
VRPALVVVGAPVLDQHLASVSVAKSSCRRFRAHLKGFGMVHRRGGYRDPESKAFIESWFSKLEERLVWGPEFETRDQTREEVTARIDRYHRRPIRGSATARRSRCDRPGRTFRLRAEVSTGRGYRPATAACSLRARRMKCVYQNSGSLATARGCVVFKGSRRSFGALRGVERDDHRRIGVEGRANTHSLVSL